MRASPGIEPGPLAPETSILPLNYEALYITIILLILIFFFCSFYFFEKKYKGTIGFEPMTAGTAVLRSTTELCALLLLFYFLFLMPLFFIPDSFIPFACCLYLFLTFILVDNVAEWSKACD